MRIVLDAMGSDQYPEPELAAALQAPQVFGEQITLVGNLDQIKPRLEALAGSNPPVKLVHAPEIIQMGDKAASSARRKAQNSMAIGMELVKSGEADASSRLVTLEARWHRFIYHRPYPWSKKACLSWHFPGQEWLLHRR